MARRRRGRDITEGERALWRSVTADIRRDAPESVFIEPPSFRPAASIPPATDRLKPPEITRPASPAPPGDDAGAFVLPSPARGVVSGLDRSTARRMARGDKRPEARVDLHGMTQDRAHRALSSFIARSAAENRRLVLVITGKGENGSGVLRHYVPRWIDTPALRRHVLGVFEAHQRHGGAGAFYVYLRRNNR